MVAHAFWAYYSSDSMKRRRKKLNPSIFSKSESAFKLSFKDIRNQGLLTQMSHKSTRSYIT